MMPGTNVQARLRAGYHRLRTLSEEYREKARAGLTRGDHYDAVVASFGGNGTSFLLKFLRDYLRVNSWDSANDGIKHANAPNHPVFDGLKVDRGIYVYGNPVIAVASLFRRDFQSHMLAKLTSAAHTDGKDYRRYVKTHQRALEAGDTEHGATVHFVTEELDGGAAIIQGRLSVHAQDTVQTLGERVMRDIELKIYPQAVAWMARGELKLENGQVWFRGQRRTAPLSLDDLDVEFR